MSKKIRIQKIVSEYFEISRRKAEFFVKEGKVRINENVASLGTKVIPKIDNIFLLNKKIKQVNKAKKYFILNKPRGFITTTNDELGRKNVCDLIKTDTRLYPVGRLDKDSEGLLIMTNDGKFANFMMHPSSHIEKTYRVTVTPRVSENDLKKLKSPSKFLKLNMMDVKILFIKNENNRSILHFTLKEGKNRQIRRMCEALGFVVKTLKRIAIGKMNLSSLKSGKYIEISLKSVLLKVGIDVRKYQNLF